MNCLPFFLLGTAFVAADCLPLQGSLEAAGLQKVELAMAGSNAEGLYSLLQDALSYSFLPMALPPAKRH